MFYQLYCLKVICDEKEMNWLRCGTLSLTYLVVSINKHCGKNIFFGNYQEYFCVPGTQVPSQTKPRHTPSADRAT